MKKLQCNSIQTKKWRFFTEIFLAVVPLESPFWPAQLMFCTYRYQNKNRAAHNERFIKEYCGEYFLWRRHGNDVTFLFRYYYTLIFRYIFQRKIAVRHENTPTYHRRENNVSGATQASFRAKFKDTSNKLGKKRHRYSAPKTLCALQCIIIQ